MTASAATALRPDRSPLVLTAQQRRSIFHLKTDIALPDERLRRLRDEANIELAARIDAIGRLAKTLGLSGRVEPIAAGTYHVVHKLISGSRSLAVRSTLHGLFTRDTGLYLDKHARAWLSSAAHELVPETVAMGFEGDGAPFDFAVSTFISAPTLRDLGDAILDEDSAWMSGLGEVLRRIHDIEACGAGLIDPEAAAAPPRGVQDTWEDYIFLNLDSHTAACLRAGMIAAEEAERIGQCFRLMRTAIKERPLRLLHGDPGVHNVCVDPATKRVVALLDWEDALAGDPLFDVAMVSTFQPERRMPLFMQGYGLAHPSPREQQLIALYFLRIALSKTVHRLRFGIADRPDRSPGHHRIYRGLAALERMLEAKT